jgi:hypothetical protein
MEAWNRTEYSELLTITVGCWVRCSALLLEGEPGRCNLSQRHLRQRGAGDGVSRLAAADGDEGCEDPTIIWLKARSMIEAWWWRRAD